jgi:glycosyltransferase involved in cell wall biosynthesis
LDEVQPDVVDLHSLTSHLELPHLRAARRAGARGVTTLHLPGLICARGTLMRFGETACDGDLAVQPCTACRLQAQGLPTVVGRALSLVPSGVGRAVARAGAMPRVLQRPFTTELAHEQRRALIKAISGESDELVALSIWQADMLIRNRVPPRKIRVCRQGVSGLPPVTASRRIPGQGAPVRVGYVGRYVEVKGFHVLVVAVLSMAGLPIEAHIWGIARTEEARVYRDAIRAQSEGHPSS